jgi:anti-sigma factor RsiW
MMTCKRIRKKLSAFLDGEVSSAEASWIEQHLANCPGCGSEARALTATYQLLERCPQPLRAEWVAGLMTADHGPPTAAGRWHPILGGRRSVVGGRTLSLLPIVTGLLVGAILGSWVWPRMSPPVSPSPIVDDTRPSPARDAEGFRGLARDPLEEVYVTLTSSRNR